jgi:molecular chaperone GrpE
MDSKDSTVDSGEEGANGAPTDRGGEDTGESTAAQALAAVSAERDRLIEEKNELVDRLLRRQAEFDNFRRRAERDRADVLEYANTESVRAILPIVDDFERALKLESADKEYARGMELIYNRLFEALKKLGLEPISSKGQKFDPNLHHAVDMVETSNVEDHTILEEFQRGYNFRGRMLRPAMVKVAVAKK